MAQTLKTTKEYTSPWQARLEQLLEGILNREEFSYDLGSDALYRQYRQQYEDQGRLAMMDTMGQTAALTGGYGSSYGTTAAQQTYQGYLRQLNDLIPELYRLALDRYQTQGETRLTQANLLQSLEDRDYDRYRDTLADRRDQRDFAYQQHRDEISDARWQAEFDQAVRQFEYKNRLGAYAPAVSSAPGVPEKAEEEKKHKRPSNGRDTIASVY